MRREVGRLRPIDVAFTFLKAELAQYDTTQLPQQPQAQQQVAQPPPQGQTILANYDQSMGEPIGAVRVIPQRYFSDVAVQGVQPLTQSRHNVGFDGSTAVREHNRARRLDDQYGESRGKRIREGKDTGDHYEGLYKPLKTIDTSIPGTWWTKPGVENVQRAYSDIPKGEAATMVGVRGDPSRFKGQFRDAVESPESFPEGFLHEGVDPKDLVFMNPTQEDHDAAWEAFDPPHGNKGWKRREFEETGEYPYMYNKYLMAEVAKRHGLDPQNFSANQYKEPAASWGN